MPARPTASFTAMRRIPVARVSVFVSLAAGVMVAAWADDRPSAAPNRALPERVDHRADAVVQRQDAARDVMIMRPQRAYIPPPYVQRISNAAPVEAPVPEREGLASRPRTPGMLSPAERNQLRKQIGDAGRDVYPR